MRTRATQSSVEDGWRGARIGAERRDRERRAMRRIPAAVDIGEPDRSVVTFGFLALALLVTAWEFSRFGTSPTAGELSRAGGAGVGALLAGSWWKLLVANLLHGNLGHVVMNAFVIVLTGRWLERLVGPALVAATVAWSALLTGIGSLLVDAPVVSIGASGVAFGIVGCAIGADPRARTATGVIARQLGIVNVVVTFIIPGISIGGHLGGLLAGVLVGWLGWSRRTSTAHPAGRPRRGAALLMLALALPGAVVLAAGPGILPNEARQLRAQVGIPLLERQLEDVLEADHVSCSARDDSLRSLECRVDGRRMFVQLAESDDLPRIVDADS